MPGAGRYHISRKIADGGMAEIFLGRQRGVEGFERPVVLKRILASLLADPQFRNQMIDEAHVAMSLNHSNIVQVLDLGHARGRYFLVLELVDGWDLNQIFNRARAASFPLPPELSLYVAAEVCRALGYAHAKTRDGQPLGIVHRDVSPHNVLVSEQGEVKLTDFGIAKAMGRREHTGHGVIKGKLAFMSPEQASGSAVDARSDLFSLGTVLYVLGTGRRPFDAPTDLEALVRVRQCQFVPPAEVAPNISPEFARITLRAMQAAPANRYQSAEEMLVDIETVQRSAFKPAGQTELKRWLAELQQLDGAPTISKAASQTPALDDSQALLLDDSEDLVFDDSSQVCQPAEGPVRPTQPTMAATPALLPTCTSPRRPSRHLRGSSRKSRDDWPSCSLWAGWLRCWRGWDYANLRGAPVWRRARRLRHARRSRRQRHQFRRRVLQRLRRLPKRRRRPPPAPRRPRLQMRTHHCHPRQKTRKRLCSSIASQPPLTRVLGEDEGEGPVKPPAAKRGQRAKPEHPLPESVSVYIESQPKGAVVKLKESRLRTVATQPALSARNRL